MTNEFVVLNSNSAYKRERERERFKTIVMAIKEEQNAV